MEIQIKLIKVLAWCGITAAVIRISLILLLGHLEPEYSQWKNFISELGAPGARYAPIMNYVGISLVGLLLILFSSGLYKTFKPGFLVGASSFFLALTGIAFLIVGFFPCDQPGCSMVNPSDTLKIHMFSAMVGLIAQTLSALFFGFRIFLKRNRNSLTTISLVLGMIAFFALFLFLRAAYLRLALNVEGSILAYPGLVQKIIVFSTDLWVFITAAYILRSLNQFPPGNSEAK